MTTLLVAIVTGIVSPLLAFLLKRWIDAQVKKAQQQEQSNQDQKNLDQDVGNTQSSTSAINESIDLQAKAKEDWIKGHS